MPRLPALRAQPPGRLNPVHHRHPDVHHDHVGRHLREQPQRLCAVPGLTHHAQVLLGRENHPETGPDQGLVVHDDDSRGHGADR